MSMKLILLHGAPATGKLTMVSAPTSTIRIAMTIATIGRLMKKRDMAQPLVADAEKGLTVTCMPGRTFCVPSATTVS